LGGLAELEESDGYFVIRGYSCPLTSVVSQHPEACRMAEALVAELTGLPIHKHCGRGESLRCRFEVAHPHFTDPE
jgi:predicted ArsR family transcriptional regulator